MPWRSSPDNPINHAALPAAWHDLIAHGDAATTAIADALNADLNAKHRPVAIAIDGYRAARFAEFTNRLRERLEANGVTVHVVNARSLFVTADEFDSIVAPSLGDDPSFGRVFQGSLEDHLDGHSVTALLARLRADHARRGERSVTIVRGCGAATPTLRAGLDRVAYLDVTREAIVARGERGEVEDLGSGSAGRGHWKRAYYVEYPVLDRHRKRVLRDADWYVDSSDEHAPALVPKAVYDALMVRLSGMPIAMKVFYMPGTFGGTEFGERFNVRGLPNTSWDYQVSVGDSSLIVDPGDGRTLELPLRAVLDAQPLRFVGAYSTRAYPDHFPLAMYMQDGYFPPDSDADFKRTHMPHHLHPDTAYTREHFLEPLGRYETYYIVRADPGAVTMHGFRDDADIDEYVSEVRRSADTGEEFDWRKYVYEHPSRTGELHQLPPGTVHGTGGRQIILEIDTNPSRESTEYSFYLYDYCRPNFNYDTNDMTGRPARLHLRHGLAAMRRNRRQAFMREHLRPDPVVIREGDGWRELSFPMYWNMPYQVNRLEFTTGIEDDTGDTFHLLALTVGERVRVRSKREPGNAVDLEAWHHLIVPAAFGAYALENLGSGTAEVVKTALITVAPEAHPEWEW